MKLKEIRIDGYKNLIDCRMPLGDFNVLVGPNNSGKTNFLEVFDLLWHICLGNEKDHEIVFKGYPFRTAGSSICHLPNYKNKPLAIGITFEVLIKDKLWIVDYDVILRNKREFISETLKAKQPSKPGKAKTYIKREGNKLEVLEKERAIADNMPSLVAVASLYAGFEGLPPELKYSVLGIEWVLLTPVFAISPNGLRSTIDKEKNIGSLYISSFDVLLAIDKMDKSTFSLFRETVCEILDFEDLTFTAENMPSPSKRPKAGVSKRVRACYIKRVGDDYYPIEEYSDGTLAVVAILAGLFDESRVEPMICIEELENCLHPAAVERLLRFLRENADKWPVLITTHSPYVLNGVSPEAVNVAVVDKDGATHFEKIKDRKALNNMLKRGFMSFGDLLATNFEEVLGGK